MRLASMVLGALASVALASPLVAAGWDVKPAQQAPTLQFAANETQALQLCGPKPAAPGQWRCAGQRAPNAPNQKIEWTWIKGGVTATDDWEARVRGGTTAADDWEARR